MERECGCKLFRLPHFDAFGLLFLGLGTLSQKHRVAYAKLMISAVDVEDADPLAPSSHWLLHQESLNAGRTSPSRLHFNLQQRKLTFEWPNSAR